MSEGIRRKEHKKQDEGALSRVMEVDSKGGFVFGFKSVNVNWQCLRTSWRESVTREDESMAMCMWAVSKAAKPPCLLRHEGKARRVGSRGLGPGEEQRSQGLGKQHDNYIWNSAATWLGDIGMLID